MTDLAKQLRDAITHSGLSVSQLGKAARVDAARLSRFLRGERDLTLTAATQLCRVLGLRLCEDDAPKAPDTSQLPGLPPRPCRKPAGRAKGPEHAKKTRHQQEE
jgi:transcriptional regulator with XRE-family HTH domain